tara:strand:- start:115 stop:1245 length:1131 start_codon:yes stop_codon:yes gene_type:complete
VLVSFDGFRPDYLDRVNVPAFNHLSRQGTVAKGLMSVFPSITFSSHYSIATGLYPEHHGIVGNRFYDPDRKKDFNYRNTDDVQDGSWWRGEPLWVTAELQGMVTASIFFPGTEAPIKNVRPTYWRPYDGSFSNQKRIQQVLTWLNSPENVRPHLITTYFSMVDRAGHREGPNSPAVDKSVAEADQLLGQLLDGIDLLPHKREIYVVVVSDHGMAQVDFDHTLTVSDFIDMTGVQAFPIGPGANLFVDDNQNHAITLRDTFNAKTDRARAFLRNEIPSHLHYRASNRIGDITIIPSSGTFVKLSAHSSVPQGMHGWDPRMPEMHGIFLISGPNIPRNTIIPSFENIHIYPLLAHILELEIPTHIDGRLAVLQTMLSF